MYLIKIHELQQPNATRTSYLFSAVAHAVFYHREGSTRPEEWRCKARRVESVSKVFGEVQGV